MSGINAVAGFFSGFPSGSYETTATDLAPSSSFRPAEAFNEPLPPGPWASSVAGNSPPGGNSTGDLRLRFSLPGQIIGPANSVPLMLASRLPMDAFAPGPSDSPTIWDDRNSARVEPSRPYGVEAFNTSLGTSLPQTDTTGSVKSGSFEPAPGQGIGVLLQQYYKPTVNSSEGFARKVQNNLEGAIGYYPAAWSNRPVYTPQDILKSDQKIRSTYGKYFSDDLIQAPSASYFVQLQNKGAYEQGIAARYPGVSPAQIDDMDNDVVMSSSGVGIYIPDSKQRFGGFSNSNLTEPLDAATDGMLRYYGRQMFSVLSTAAQRAEDPQIFNAAANAVTNGLVAYFKSQMTGIPSKEALPGSEYAANAGRMGWAAQTFGPDALGKAFFGGDTNEMNQIFSFGATHWAEEQLAAAQIREQLGAK